MKVTRIPGQSAPPIAALLWIDPAHPEAGGTGHTLRACRLQTIPVVPQEHWGKWLRTKY
jgi:hypothetical protein